MAPTPNLRRYLQSAPGFENVDARSLDVLERIAARFGRWMHGQFIMDVTVPPDADVEELKRMVTEHDPLMSVVEGIRASVMGDGIARIIDQIRGPTPVAPQARVAAVAINDLKPVEVREATEHARIRKAIDIAVAMDIVKETVYPSSNPNARHGYLLTGKHYPMFRYDPSQLQPAIQSSQVELFQFAHLLYAQGVTSTMHIEGSWVGSTIPSFTGVNIPIGGDKIPLSDPRAQQFLFDKPSALAQVMDQILVAQASRRGNAPDFHRLTNFSHITGAHSRETQTFIEKEMQPRAEEDARFKIKYHALYASLPERGPVTLNFQMRQSPSQRPEVHLGGRWYDVEEVENDLAKSIEYDAKMQEVSRMREEDLACHFRNMPEGKIPMGFVGLAHGPPLLQLLQPYMHVHKIMPLASMPYDNPQNLDPTQGGTRQRWTAALLEWIRSQKKT